jgi:hypothetical protein
MLLFLPMKKDAKYPEDSLILFSSKLPKKQQFIDNYRTRRKIECLFKNSISNGFHIEDMNLKSYSETRFKPYTDSVINDAKVVRKVRKKRIVFLVRISKNILTPNRHSTNF